MESVLGVAVVGTGFGARVHVPALRAAGFEVLALVGQDPDRTKRRADRLEVPRPLTSLAEALDDPDVHAVTVATPPDTHAELVCAAAQAGRHVLCEKPFALDGNQARAMAGAVEDAGVAGVVGHEFRWAPDRVAVAQLLAGGAVGEPRLASLLSWIDLVADPAAAMPRWWFDAERGGGWLGASGSHLVDQCRTWLGEVETVSATLGVVSARPDDAAEDSFTLCLRMRSGATAVLQQTAGAWGPAIGVTRVAGTAGTVWTDAESRVWVANPGGTRQVEVPAEDEGGPDREFRGAANRFTHLELGPYTQLASAWRDAILGRAPGSGPRAATFADGVAVTDVLDAARESAAAGGTVKVVRTDG